MALRILLAPPGAGKTEYILARLEDLCGSEPWPQVWILLPGRAQEEAFRERLARREGPGVRFHLTTLDFPRLTLRLLRMAAIPARALDGETRRALLRALLAGLREEDALPLFGEIATTPGMLRAAGNFLSRLKSQLVTPQRFAAAAQSPRELDLARIAARMETQLRELRLADAEDLTLQARAALMEGRLDAGLADLRLLVDGYDQFTPLQASLLLRLAERVDEALITLPTAPKREEVAGRRFADTLRLLQHHANSSPQVEQLPARRDARPPALWHLGSRLFLDDGPKFPAGPAIQLIEAPDAAREALAITRRIRRLLLESDARPEDCLIALREYERYAGHFRNAAREHGLPFVFQHGEPLLTSPVVMTLLALLALPSLDFPRRELLDALGAPAFAIPGLGRAEVARLDFLGRGQLVTRGRERWLEALKPVPKTAAVDDDAAECRTLAYSLTRFMDAITPPEHGSPGEYLRWLEELCGLDDDPEEERYSLGMHLCAEKGTVAEREALDALRVLLRRGQRAETLLSGLGLGRELDGARFPGELRATLAGAHFGVAPRRAGHVLVTSVHEARGLPHRHVFLPGLAAGSFPTPRSDDPLLLESERVSLAQRGIPLEAPRRADDDALFLELVSLARQSLTLTRPGTQDGNPLAASHLWRAVRTLFPDLEEQRVRAGELPPYDALASPGEALQLLAATEKQHAGERLRRWLAHEHGGLLAHVRHARAVELGRLSSRQPHDRHSGRIEDAALIAHVAEQLGPQRLWSQSQLGELGACRYRFFARRLLGLEAPEQLQAGLDGPTLGSLNHTILEQTYRAVRQRGLGISEANREQALALLGEAAAQVFARAPRALRFVPDALWAQEQAAILRRLRVLLRRDFSADSPLGRKLGGAERIPWAQERRFGQHGEEPLLLPIEVEGMGEQLRARGVIDRIDRAGRRLLVVDYKSGSTEVPVSAMRAGLDFQMMLYLYAADLLRVESDAPLSVAGGLFLHIRGAKTSGWIDPQGKGAEALEEARAHIGHDISAARRGDFSAHARKPIDGRCARWCEFAQLCRLAGTAQRKPGAV